MTDSTDPLGSSRGWRWRSSDRPDFAPAPGPVQESVWDYPRPPVFYPDAREIVVRWGSREVARTCRAIRVLETSHPPSFYLPREDVSCHLLKPGSGTSFCEWKEAAHYFSLVDGERRLINVAWSYPQPSPSWAATAGMIAFCPASLECSVGSATVTAQSGGFYGGWITPELVGPFKGELGSTGW